MSSTSETNETNETVMPTVIAGITALPKIYVGVRPCGCVMFMWEHSKEHPIIHRNGLRNCARRFMDVEQVTEAQAKLLPHECEQCAPPTKARCNRRCCQREQSDVATPVSEHLDTGKMVSALV